VVAELVADALERAPEKVLAAVAGGVVAAFPDRITRRVLGESPPAGGQEQISELRGCELRATSNAASGLTPVLN
jgi:hypothetical protein